LHANYIEALLGDHFTRSLPPWAAIGIDLVLGLILYVAFESAKGWGQLWVLFLAIIPFVAAYISFVMFGRYLDFVLPTGLYFVHMLYEHLSQYMQLLKTAAFVKKVP
jgi:hypothetical protein